MACCPFHDDKHPSMKVDRRFHCFGCQADGDVIDFTARLFGLNKKEAALKLAEDFSVRYDAKGHDPPRRRPVRRKISEELRYRQAEQKCFRVLCDYLHLLERWEKEYAPQTPEETWNPLFVEALQKKPYTEYLLDILLSGSMVCSKQLFKEALGHTYDEPKRWQLHNINEIMNTVVTGWKPFSNPRMFAGYGRQRGWERDVSGNELPGNEDGFVELTEEECRQMELPKEWIA